MNDDVCGHRALPGVRCHLLAGHWHRHHRTWRIGGLLEIKTSWAKEPTPFSWELFWEAIRTMFCLGAFVLMLALAVRWR